jgi:hypothetical protein
MKTIGALVLLLVAANVAVAVLRRPAPSRVDHLAIEPAAASPPQGRSARRTAVSDRVVALDPGACTGQLEASRARTTSYRALVRKNRPLSLRFTTEPRNDTRLEETTSNVERILGRSLAPGSVECRGTQGQICRITGTSAEELPRFYEIHQDGWAQSTIRGMQVGGRSGVHLLLGPPGQQPGLPVLDAFVANFRSSDGLRACRDRYRDKPGQLFASVLLTEEQIDEGRAQHPTIEYVGGQAMNAFEDCVLAALTAAAASYELPPNVAPARLGRLLFGMDENQPGKPGPKM